MPEAVELPKRPGEPKFAPPQTVRPAPRALGWKSDAARAEFDNLPGSNPWTPLVPRSKLLEDAAA